MSSPRNRLASETSPYLLQHADNPVNWYPWGEAALQAARRDNKPILLSIGYSACHWCHVMAHESFEDPATAELMNQHFINIKVDREERPDLDKIYQAAHSLLTSRSGGWPLTVFLSPDNQVPFFAGTYFPSTERYNMPTFSQILTMVAEAYHSKKQEIEEQNASISQALQSLSSHTPNTEKLTSLPLDLARKQIGHAFDASNGGFSAAPKFPHADIVERLLRHHLFLKQQHKGDTEALNMAGFTLHKMALGGFQDQIGGGFFRYSTDDQWMIPHFEKMLYDNAQLIALYAQAYALSGEAAYRETFEHAADWVMREMQTTQGGYCSALDADTDKIEGKSYVWTIEEIKALLSTDEYELCASKYNLHEPANFEGKWHLYSRVSNKQLASQLSLEADELQQQLHSIQQKLLRHRNSRPQPGRDDKILCAWNALMIHGMSLAGRRTQQASYINSAVQAADFIYQQLWKNQRLLASYKDGKAQLNAYLDDYAYLLQALLELLQARWNNVYYQWALQIADALLEHFQDKNEGGFYFTSHDHETLIQRSKTFADDAMPNGNAVAASALQQLGFLCGNTQYLDAAEHTLRCAYNSLSEQAISHCSLLHVLEQHLTPVINIILRGRRDQLTQWQNLTDQRYIPGLNCYSIEHDSPIDASLADKKPLGEICAYICQGNSCRPAITEIADYKNFIDQL